MAKRISPWARRYANCGATSMNFVRTRRKVTRRPRWTRLPATATKIPNSVGFWDANPPQYLPEFEVGRGATNTMWLPNHQATANPKGFIPRVRYKGAFVTGEAVDLVPGWNCVSVQIEGVKRGYMVWCGLGNWRAAF